MSKNDPHFEVKLGVKITPKRGYPVPNIFTPFWSYNNSLKITAWSLIVILKQALTTSQVFRLVAGFQLANHNRWNVESFKILRYLSVLQKQKRRPSLTKYSALLNLPENVSAVVIITIHKGENKTRQIWATVICLVCSV